MKTHLVSVLSSEERDLVTRLALQVTLSRGSEETLLVCSGCDPVTEDKDGLHQVHGNYFVLHLIQSLIVTPEAT